MIQSLISECMEIKFDTNSFLSNNEQQRLSLSMPHLTETKITNTRSKVKKNSILTKSSREPKINQKYKQSINPSKRHRDRLNGELDSLARLLPFPQDVIARLDKLSILRLSVSFLRNKNFFKGVFQEKQQKEKNTKTQKSQFSSVLSNALDGFLLVLTLDGEVFFASESVKDYLGYSQSSVLHQQFDTLVHDDDKDELSSYLQQASDEKIIEIDTDTGEPNDEKDEHREFTIRLKSVLNNGTSDIYKPFKLSGRIQRLNIKPSTEGLKYALFAFCTPARSSTSLLEIRMKTTLFCSKNRIDLSFLDLDARGKEYFGYSKKDIFGRSSYVLVHRQDSQHVRCKHTELMTCGKTSIGTFRLLNKSNEWNWISGYARVLYKNGKPDYMVTTNRILTEAEGQAMLKVRDEADYKALENIGLVEPDNPADALELGFPNRCAFNSFDTMSDVPIEMPIEDFAGLTKHSRQIATASKKSNPSPVFDNQNDTILFKNNPLHEVSQISPPEQHLQQLSSPQQQPQQFSSPQQQPRQLPSPQQQLRQFPPQQQLRQLPSPEQQLRQLPSPEQQLQQLPSPEQQLQQLPSPEQQLRQLPSPEQQLRQLTLPQQQLFMEEVNSPNSPIKISIQCRNNQSIQQTSPNELFTDTCIKIEPDKSSGFMDLEQSSHYSVPQTTRNGRRQQQEQSLLHSSLNPLEHSNIPLTQTFSKNIFDDLPIDFDLSNNSKSPTSLQPVSQLRFSFLPPSIPDEKLRPTKCEVNTTDLSSLFPSSNEHLRHCVSDNDVGGSYINRHADDFGNDLLSDCLQQYQHQKQQHQKQQDDACCKTYGQDFANWATPDSRLPPFTPMFSLLNAVNNNNLSGSFNTGTSTTNSILWENSYYL